MIRISAARRQFTGFFPKMLCKSISYPPPPGSDAYRVTVSYVPGRGMVLPRPCRPRRSSSPFRPRAPSSGTTCCEFHPVAGKDAYTSEPAACSFTPDRTPVPCRNSRCAHRPRFRLRLSGVGDQVPAVSPPMTNRRSGAAARLGLRRAPLRLHSIVVRGLSGLGGSPRRRARPSRKSLSRPPITAGVEMICSYPDQSIPMEGAGVSAGLPYPKGANQ